MPLAWGDFYLVGDINGWAKGESYKFSDDNGTGTYTLPNNAPINVSSTAFNDGKSKFKIINDNGGGDAAWTWYGSTGECNIHHNHHENIPTMDGGNNNDFILQSPGLTGFSFTLDGGKPKLTVTREESKLSILFKNGDNPDTYESTDMTHTSTGWTISKTISQYQKFHFADEFGQWFGWTGGDYGIGSDIINNTFEIKAGDKNFQMNVAAGDYIFDVNSAVNSMRIYNSNSAEEKSLSEIQSSGVVGKPYTINEALQVVYVNTINNKVFARDLTGTTATPNGINYMTTVAKEPGSLEQYNWVMLDFTGTNLLTSLSAYPNPNPNTNTNKTNNNIALIQGLKGVYTDDNNYTIKVTDITTVSQGTAFTPNVYCPANFQVDGNGCQTGYKVEWVTDQNTGKVNMVVGTTANEVTYWFMTPKPMEVFELSGALWCGDGFYMEGRDFVAEHIDPETGKTIPAKWYNPAGLKGGIGLDKSCNSTTSPDLKQGQSYRFLTVAWKKVSGSKSEASYDEPLRISLNPEPGSNLNTTIQAGAINLTGAADQIVTGVSEVKTGSDVVSVTYCDLAGRMSQKPFAGVNIIVTRYSDGTVKTTKAIK